MKIDCQIYYWGRILFRTKISPEHLEKIRLLCKKVVSLNHNEHLAGDIIHEYRIDVLEYSKIMEDYFKAYQNAYQNFNGDPCPPFKVNQAWVNFMKAGDFNPPHVHNYCAFSSVLYTSVPEILKQENKNYKGTLKGGGAGAISFLNGEMVEHSRSMQTVFPEEGDFFMFPSDLTHVVWPFKSDCERISVAANYQESDLKK